MCSAPLILAVCSAPLETQRSCSCQRPRQGDVPGTWFAQQGLWLAGRPACAWSCSLGDRTLGWQGQRRPEGGAGPRVPGPHRNPCGLQVRGGTIGVRVPVSWLRACLCVCVCVCVVSFLDCRTRARTRGGQREQLARAAVPAIEGIATLANTIDHQTLLQRWALFRWEQLLPWL